MVKKYIVKLDEHISVGHFQKGPGDVFEIDELFIANHGLRDKVEEVSDGFAPPLSFHGEADHSDSIEAGN